MQPDPSSAFWKTRIPWVICAVAGAAALAGYFLGHKSGPHEPSQRASGSSRSTPPSLTARPLSQSQDPQKKALAALPPSESNQDAAKSAVRRALALFRDGLMNQRAAADAIALLRSLTPEQSHEALQIAVSLPEDIHRNVLIAGILGRIAEFDPQSAIRFLEGEGGKYRANLGAEAIHGVIASWLATDPKGAWEWFFSTAPEATLQGNTFEPAAAAAQPLFETLAASDVAAAVSSLQRLEGTAVYGRALEGLIQGALRGGMHPQALSAAAGIADETSRTFAHVRILEDWAALDPAAASTWYDNQYPDDPRGNIRNGLATAWMAEDPEAAAEWWWDHTPDTQKAASLKRMVGVWALRDPAGASQWLHSFEAGPELDSAVAALVDSAARGHPREALEWTRAITDSDLRVNAYETAVRIWAGFNPSEAYDYLSQSQELPPERRDALLLAITPPELRQ